MSATLWPTIHDLTERAARRWEFPAPRLVPALPRHRAIYDGKANRGTRRLVLRVHRFGRPNQPLATTMILATLAHELAHLATWHEPGDDHGPRWRKTTKEIAEWIRSLGHKVSPNLYVGTFPERYLPRHRRKRKRKQ